MRIAACAALSGVVLFGCTDATPPTNPTTPFVDSQSGLFGAMSSASISYQQIPRSGRLTVELTWDDPNINLDLYLTSPACGTLYPLANCAIIQRSVAATGTRELVSKTVVAGETIMFHVDNRSPVNHTAGYRVAIE